MIRKGRAARMSALERLWRRRRLSALGRKPPVSVACLARVTRLGRFVRTRNRTLNVLPVAARKQAASSRALRPLWQSANAPRRTELPSESRRSGFAIAQTERAAGGGSSYVIRLARPTELERTTPRSYQARSEAGSSVTRHSPAWTALT